VPGIAVQRMFVYGTLRVGQAARHLIEDHVVGSEVATCNGTLYDFPDGYPGLLLDGRTVVRGELVHLSDLAALLPRLDAYEGKEFERVLTEVETTSGVQYAWVYVLAHPGMATGGQPVPGGDWTSR